MPPPDFTTIAEAALTAMAGHATSLGVSGAAVVAWTDHIPATGWTSLMRTVGAMVQGENNLVGIAYGKAVEMADTAQDSGSGIRPTRHGENGYQGGLIRPMAGGYVLAVFSGASGEQDRDISQAALRIFAQRYG